MTTVEIPESFARCMRDVYGESGAAWIVRLPSIVAECERRWEIAVDAPFALTYNYVAPARRADGTLAVLKVGYPCGELLSEIAALKCF
ncbi:MAG: aminoglycoside resistance protein, partial [Tepidiformaceae bacterium]